MCDRNDETPPAGTFWPWASSDKGKSDFLPTSGNDTVKHFGEDFRGYFM